MAKSNKISYSEAPMGIGKMKEKSGPKCAATSNAGGSSESSRPTWSRAKDDGTKMGSERRPDPGTDPARISIGSTVPKKRHMQDPL